jgi:hypothetical protein
MQLQTKEAIPSFIQLLNHNDTDIRKNAINTLKQLQAKEAIPNLIPLLKDYDIDIRKNALYALIKLQAKEAIPNIIPLLKDNDEYVFSAAIYSLIYFQAKEAIPNIMSLLKDSRPYIRSNAIDALRKLQAKEAIPDIIPFLNDDNSSVHFTAIEALKQLDSRSVVAFKITQLRVLVEQHLLQVAIILIWLFFVNYNPFKNVVARYSMAFIYTVLSIWVAWMIAYVTFYLDIFSLVSADNLLVVTVINTSQLVSKYPLQILVMLVWLFFRYLRLFYRYG